LNGDGPLIPTKAKTNSCLNLLSGISSRLGS
jgi:hypothetical protein